MEKKDYSQRQGKDFTPEEKAEIVTRAKQIGTRRAAEEFGISYWVVKYLRYYDKGTPVEGRSRVKKTATEKVTEKMKIKKADNKNIFSDRALKYDISALMSENEILKERSFKCEDRAIKRDNI